MAPGDHQVRGTMRDQGITRAAVPEDQGITRAAVPGGHQGRGTRGPEDHQGRDTRVPGGPGDHQVRGTTTILPGLQSYILDHTQQVCVYETRRLHSNVDVEIN